LKPLTSNARKISGALGSSIATATALEARSAPNVAILRLSMLIRVMK